MNGGIFARCLLASIAMVSGRAQVQNIEYGSWALADLNWV